MDPLTVIFVPGGYAMMLALLSPVAIFAHRVWRRRGFRRNAARCCGRCDAPVSLADELYWFDGLLVCDACAGTLRRRLTLGIPALAFIATGFALTSGGAFVTSLAQGGPGLGWWLDGRWLPLLLPSLGLGLATMAAVGRAKRANRLATGSPTRLSLGHDPEGPVRLRILADERGDLP